MGADAGGRGNRDRKPIVENCRSLDINDLVREKIVRANADHRGGWEWRTDPEDEKPCASIGFRVRTGENGGTLRLDYTVTVIDAGHSKAAELKSYAIELVTTKLPTDGFRWWFICGAKRADKERACRRRVGMLYLPGGEKGTVFACRHCYGLTYRSCRESRSYQAMWSSLGASCGMTGKVAKRLLDERWNGERKAEERLRQRGVLIDTAKKTDIPPTPMDAVN